MIRTLRPYEPLPEGTPGRYANQQGYIRLRWRIGPGEYVEEYEHRVVMGRPAGMHVHHRDEDKVNNDPSNLVVLTPEEHAQLHGWERGWPLPLWAEARRLYEAEGWSLLEIRDALGMDNAVLSRGLRKRGVAMRPRRRYRTLDAHEAEIVEALKAGERVGALARQYGVRHIVVDAIRKRHGLPGRPPGRPPRSAAA